MWSCVCNNTMSDVYPGGAGSDFPEVEFSIVFPIGLHVIYY